MAALKVFISSTCYDLSIVRSELRSFIYNLGHEPVMSEYNDILFDPKDHTHESCVNEIRNTDAVVLIIGSRFGGKAIPQAVSKINIDYLKNTSKSTEIFNEPNKISITQMEIFKAIELDIPIYTFVDSKVLSDHHLYNQQIDFYAKIKTKRQKSPKITKRNGCSKSKHTNHINTQRTQSKQIAFFVSKQIGKVLKCHLKAIIIKNGIKVFMQPYPRINYFAFYTALCLYISRYSSYEH